MARPRFHALATAPFAWGAYRRWGLGAALGLLTTGIFVDLDHLVDYAWIRLQGHRRHYIAPLHAWELVLAGGALAWWARLRRRQGERSTTRPPSTPHDRLRQGWAERVAAGLAAGLLVHLIQDVLTNHPTHAGVYALVYRLAHRFDRDRIGWDEHNSFHQWTGRPWYTWI